MEPFQSVYDLDRFAVTKSIAEEGSDEFTSPCGHRAV